MKIEKLDYAIHIFEDSVKYKVENNWYETGTGFTDGEVNMVTFRADDVILHIGDYEYEINLILINDRKLGISLNETKEALKVLHHLKRLADEKENQGWLKI